MNGTHDAPPPAVLDYRLPSTGSHRVQRVMRELEKAETLGAASLGVKLLVGLPLCLLPPLVVTAVLKAVEREFRADVLPGFEMTFLLATAVVVPLLMRLERRTRGEYFSDGVRGGMVADESPYTASSYGEWELRTSTLAWVAYVEVALTGPRLLWSAIDQMRGRTPVDPPLRVAAAEIAIELLEASESKPLRELIRPDRPPRVVARAIHYLIRRDWVGISARRDRVWLSSPIRERLGKL